MKRGTWRQQQYLMRCVPYVQHPPIVHAAFRFITRKITHGTNKSKLVIHALRRRLRKSVVLHTHSVLTVGSVRRGLNSPRIGEEYLRTQFVYPDGLLARTTFTPNDSDTRETEQPESPGNLPIVLPQLPLLSLPYIYPDTDSGYCS